MAGHAARDGSTVGKSATALSLKLFVAREDPLMMLQRTSGLKMSSNPNWRSTARQTSLTWMRQLSFGDLPDKTHCFKIDRCHGGKKSKERITVLLCSNMDGTEKMPPLMIGKFNNPRCFHGVKKLPVEYKANTKAWMTAEIFQEWLRSFDREMDRQNRKVLLVLDNCSAHKIPQLNATDILFLPPNATSKLQPCDAGIIQNMKVHYRTAKVLKLVAFTDAGGSAENYQFSLLDAACTLKQAWDKVSPITISRCFRKAGFKIDEETEMDESTEEHLDSETEKLFEEWDVPASDYIRVDDNVATSEPQKPATGIEDPTPSTSAAPEQNGPSEEHSDEEEDFGEQTEKVSRKTVLDCVRKINTYCLQADCGHKLLNSFNAFVQVVEKHFACTGRQEKITDFYAKKDPGEKDQEREHTREGVMTDQGETESMGGEDEERGRNNVGSGRGNRGKEDVDGKGDKRGRGDKEKGRQHEGVVRGDDVAGEESTKR